MWQTITEMGKSGLKQAYGVLAEFALYVTIALACALVIYAIVIRNKDDEYLAKSRKLIVGIIIGYSAAVISLIGFLMLAKEIVDGGITANFWLMFGLFVLVAVGIVSSLILKKKGFAWTKWLTLGFVIAFVVYAIVLVCVIPPEDGYMPLSWTMYLVSAILVAVIITLALVFGKETEYNSKSLTYAAVCIALSFALSYIKFFSLPQGGSVTFASLLPLALYAYMFGTRKGVIAGVVYGLLQFIQSPQFYEPMQALIDYPIAFGAIGLAGIARNFKFLKGNMLAEFALGTTIAVLFRYVSHVISGYYVFSSWAMEGFNAVSWAFVYNLYTLADLAIVLAVGLLALSTKAVRKTINSVMDVNLQ